MINEHSDNANAPFSGAQAEPLLPKSVEVVVGERGVERALKHLKRKMASEGILRELKRRRHYMKPSIKKRKKEAEAARRRRKRVRMMEGKGSIAPSAQAPGKSGDSAA